MAKSKYIKRGVKRKHNIIQGILPLLEEIAKIEGVKKIVPSVISYSPVRSVHQVRIKFQREVVSGFKLIAHGKGSIQDIFVIVDGSKKKNVENKLKEYISRINTIEYKSSSIILRGKTDDQFNI